MGANRIMIDLKDGTRIHDVETTNNGHIVKIGTTPIKTIWDLPFQFEDIQEIKSEV